MQELWRGLGWGWGWGCRREGETLEIEALEHVLFVVQGSGFSVRVYLHVVAVR
jgi:hypothetical protein